MKYHIERSIIIDAPLQKVRSFIEDFKNWNTWSPWTIAEPGCPITIEGKPNSSGHTMSWDGEIIGSGTNTIVATQENRIDYDLVFLKPFKSKAKTSFLFEEDNGKTKVTWAMDSSMPFFLFFMVPTMKSWIEMDYDRGLTMLKAMAEQGKIEATTTNNGIVNFEGFSYIGIKKTSSMEKMPKEMEACFLKIVEDLKQHGKEAKHWACLYPKVDMKNKMFTYIALASAENLEGIDLGENYVRGEIQSGKALEIKHHGSYHFLGNAWTMGMMYVRAKKMKKNGPPFEYYWNNPSTTAEKDLETSIYFPVK